MKNKSLIISLIVFLSFIVIGLTVFMIMLFDDNSFGYEHIFHFNTRATKILEKSYDLKDIDIDNALGDIEIRNSDSNEIKVVAYGTKKNAITVNDDEKLKIKYRGRNNFCIGLCFNKNDIVIYLPKNYNGNIYINNDLGDVEIGDISKASLNIECDKGDIDVDSIKSLNIKASLGDIKVGNISSYLYLKSNSGDVHINRMSLDKNSTIKSKLGDVKINHIRNVYIDAKTNLGDTEVDNSDRHSDITLNIENNLGDIKVN